MMLKAEENSEEAWQAPFFDDYSFDESDSIDLESFYAILEEESDPGPTLSMGSFKDLSCENLGELKSVEVDHDRSSPHLQNGIQDLNDASQIGDSLQELPPWYGLEQYSEHFSSTEGKNFGSWFETEGYVEPLYCNADSKSMINLIPKCSATFNSSTEHTNYSSSCIDSLGFLYTKSENGNEEHFTHAGGDLNSKCDSSGMMVDSSGLTSGSFCALTGNSMEGLGVPEINQFSYTGDLPLPDASDQVSDILSGIGDRCSSELVCGNSGIVADSGHFSSSGLLGPHISDFPVVDGNKKKICIKIKRENKFTTSHNISTSDRMDLGTELTVNAMSSTKAYATGHSGMSKSMVKSFKSEDSAHCSQIKLSSSFDADARNVAGDTSRKLKPHIHPYKLVKKELTCVGDGHETKFLPSKSTYYLPSDCVSSHPSIHPVSSNKMLTVKDVIKDKFFPSRSGSSQSGEVIQCNPSIYPIDDDDDTDICILEDISDPRNPPSQKSIITSQRSAVSDTICRTGMLGTRLMTSDETLTFRLAMQDLSQPKSEAKLPEGVLNIDLLRHQRIALSWMVQKETASLHCSGGILADDQGLGKTVSTIALILKERPPSSKLVSIKQDELRPLNLDEDDNDNNKVERSLEVPQNASILAKGRPAAGTLVVCPTSVLRQWADELQNKVTKEARLSVLLYHGSNRTKNALELASYDVVLTTYSIVTMEVPKQALVDKEDDVKPEGHDSPTVEPSSNRKRKYPPSSIKKNRNDKKGLNGALLDSGARPLARVGWFRVVLDEAQSIKNHRTQVARACWGLRAKRRWCLSGTPIQNAVDDLYSYFRFLRYDPYAVYRSFCSMIKVPISKNPTNGYKKLQAVLKTIMLRRTKGTQIDGEPIINLPPKSIELKKVEFSDGERDFYSKLEADSRAQFKVYAAAGTVKQNYVNILLMLLRLRQACDHPLLVKGYDSNSVWKASVDMAKNLPKEKQISLLNRLEACVAICDICNDPPEDAVVTICGHVFCNQCMCEHLTGDDSICPAVQCKVHLRPTSVFSIEALNTALSDQPGPDCSLEKSSQLIKTTESLLEKVFSPFVKKPEPHSELCCESSKIKAALEVLQSLSKSSDSSPKEDFSESVMDKNDHACSKVSEKAIVFSQWTRMLDLLEAQLKNSSIQYRRLDGTMSIIARDKAVKDFNTLPEVSVMIMSLKAASLGLNMVAACHVILLDLWWNPTTEDQAIDRAHRIGQKRPVTVVRLTVKDTVEDRILALQQKKRMMVASAFGEDENGSRQTRLTVDDLKYLFMD
ncbi:hypothetical protein GIB67_028399 [Kingdonia uniflora]|uniref:Helicase-like transcription factor CHR28 n=1 Tax=Kingdonia uniflora TaxID=39325 RepID=A0A7J7MI13_9MAGN|nr:hypothetical protein GIB67_028399 [Kingdonia uniflora]